MLRIAEKYEFAAIHRRAILRLLEIASAAEKVTVGRQFRCRELLYRGYREISHRSPSLTLEEARCLAIEDVVLVAQGRDAVNRFGSYHPSWFDEVFSGALSEMDATLPYRDEPLWKADCF